MHKIKTRCLYLDLTCGQTVEPNKGFMCTSTCKTNDLVTEKNQRNKRTLLCEQNPDFCTNPTSLHTTRTPQLKTVIYRSESDFYPFSTCPITTTTILFIEEGDEL